MRISAKARYGIAATITMAQYHKDENVTIIRISEHLDISKIYLEQVFSLLKRADIVVSTKGAQGGYQLAKPATQITVFDLLTALDQILFEKTESTVSKTAHSIEKTMQSLIFTQIDTNLETMLKNITLQDLVDESEKNNNDQNFMFYI